MVEKNIYIKTTEFAIQKGREGISYNELREYLLKSDLEYIDKYPESFIIWFFAYFQHPKATWLANRFETGQGITTRNNLEKEFQKFYSSKVYLSYKGHMEYIEYIELDEARKSSQEAHRDATKAFHLARFALWVSASLALVSIVLQIWSFLFPG